MAISEGGEPGSEVVSSGRGLGVGLQKVNYVLVGGFLCHFFSGLSILGRKKNREKAKSLTEECWIPSWLFMLKIWL